MAICPATGNGCIDDLCYGNGCLKLPGETMIDYCQGGCGALVGIDGTDQDDACECDLVEWDELDETSDATTAK